MQYTDKDRDRFWSKVQRGKAAECWEWQGAVGSSGYGNIGMGRYPNGKQRILAAHRVAFELAYGEIPEGEVVRHRCDNRRCCNPRHLLPGTQAENVADMWRRGRGSAGEMHPQTKLPDSAVRRIRERFAAGQASQRKLAAEYGVAQEWVGEIVRGERRKAAGGPITKVGRGRKVAA